MNTLISPDNTWALWAVIAGGTTVAIWLEQTYKWAGKLSGPVLALVIAMVLSNAHVMPAEAPAYDFLSDYLVPLAIPLLLFRANAVQIIRSTGGAFLAFHLSAVGTLLGTLVAVAVFRHWIPSPDIENAGGLMAASYTGGGVNFMAMKTSYDVSPQVSNPLIVADNFVMASLFVVLLAAATSRFFRRLYPHPHSQATDSAEAGNLAAQHWQRKGIGLLDLAKSLAIALVIVALAKLLETQLKLGFGRISSPGMAIAMLQNLCTNQFVLITGIAMLAATIFHRPMSRINGPEELGTFLLYLFLFGIGLPASLKEVLLNAPLFFVFCALIALVNLTVTLLLGKVFRCNLEDLLLAVNANLGGAPSAAAMAISAGWPRLVLPGILIGVWGYVIGTPVGIIVMETLKRIGL